jgi:hypothetical protein
MRVYQFRHVGIVLLIYANIAGFAFARSTYVFLHFAAWFFHFD